MSNQIEWSRAFIRSGFNFRELDHTFDFTGENFQTEQFLRSILDELDQNRDYKFGIFSPSSSTVDESAWLNAIEKLHGGSEGGESGMDNIDLQIMDTYMAGIIRWVNAGGLGTHFSCDGHECKEPEMKLEDATLTSALDKFLQNISDGQWRFAHSHFSNNGLLPTTLVSANSGDVSHFERFLLGFRTPMCAHTFRQVRGDTVLSTNLPC